MSFVALKRPITLLAATFAILALSLMGRSLAGPTDCERLQIAVNQLARAKSASERAHAALCLAAYGQKADATALSHLITSLNGDRDDTVRAAVAFAIGDIAGKQAKGREPGQYEEMLIEALSTSLAREPSAIVRQQIAQAAGSFNHSSAVKLIDAALRDSSQSVRVEAQGAKLKRDQRLMKLVTG